MVSDRQLMDRSDEDAVDGCFLTPENEMQGSEHTQKLDRSYRWGDWGKGKTREGRYRR